MRDDRNELVDTGTWVKLTWRGDVAIGLVCAVEYGKMCIIDVNSGNRWDEPVTTDHLHVTRLDNLAGPKDVVAEIISAKQARRLIKWE